MKRIFKLKGLRTYLAAALAVILLGCVATGVGWYAYSDNPPPQLWGVDDTTWLTVASNSETGGPTREKPVYIEAQVERLYGLHIGTPIRVRYKIVAQNSVKMRFETLKRGILSRYRTTWRIVEPPKLVSEVSKDGFTTRILELTVAVWEPPSLPESVPLPPPTNFLPPPKSQQKTAPPVAVAQSPETAAAGATAPVAAPPTAEDAVEQLWPFTVEFVVSWEDWKPNNPKWVYIETPPVQFGFASLVEPDADQHGLDMGPLADVPEHRNRIGVAMVQAGYVVAFGGGVYLVALFIGWLRRRRLPTPIPGEVVAYREALATAEQAKHMRSHLVQVRIAVREFFGGATLADEDLVALWANHPQQHLVAETLAVLSGAVLAGRLSAFDERKIAEAMDSIVEERLRPDVPDTWWLRVRAKARARTTALVRLLKPKALLDRIPRWRRR
jgi:hypothetical protein